MAPLQHHPAKLGRPRGGLRCVLYLVSICVFPAASGDLDRKTTDAEQLWDAVLRLTGLSNTELRMATQDLHNMAPASQVETWRENVQCASSGTSGACVGEAMARLIAALGENKQLPLRGFEPFRGDPLFDYWKKRDSMEFQSWQTGWATSSSEPLEALVPEGQPLVIPRLQAAAFVREASRRIRQLTGISKGGELGRCLEWDDPFYMVKVFGHLCRRFDIFHYASEARGHEVKKVVYNRGTRRLFMDILSPPVWFPRDYGLVVCLFVLEHVPDPHGAMRGVARALLPGGFALLGAPFVDGIHACPDDFLRYTPHGLRHVVESAGLEVVWSFAPGGSAVAAGEILGMKSSYWSEKDILKEDDTHPLSVFVLARKPGQSRLGPSWRNTSFVDGSERERLGSFAVPAASRSGSRS